MPFEMTFAQEGTFKALHAAQAWLRLHGYSCGSTCSMGPVGILKGDYCIAKWRNLTRKERSELDGTLDGNFREGPLVLRLKKAPELNAYQVGDNDIVAAYDPAGAAKLLCELCGYPLDEFTKDDVELVPEAVLDNTVAFDVDEGKVVTLEKTLRQELAELTEPAYMHGWE